MTYVAEAIGIGLRGLVWGRRGSALLAAVAASLVVAVLVPSGTDAAGGAGAPLIEGLSASHVTETSAKLEAVINPDGFATKYTFWVEYAPCQHGAGECAIGIQTETVAKGSLVAGNKAVAVHRGLTKLKHGCQYTYWVVASNSHGMTESGRANFLTSGSEGLGCLR